MAIYHFSAKTGTRAGGQSARAKFDYIAREGSAHEQRDPRLHVESGHMPAFAAADAALYWQAADDHERANGRLFKHLEIALPRELSFEQSRELVRDFAEKVTSGVGGGNLPYTFTIHAGGARDTSQAEISRSNIHADVMISERINDAIDRGPELWFARAATGKNKTAAEGGAKKTDALKPQEWLENTRKLWADMANQALAEAGHDARIDHRTLLAQREEALAMGDHARAAELDRAPGQHLGAKAHGFEQRHAANGDDVKSRRRLHHEERQREADAIKVQDSVLDRAIEREEAAQREDRLRLKDIITRRIAAESKKEIDHDGRNGRPEGHDGPRAGADAHPAAGGPQPGAGHGGRGAGADAERRDRARALGIEEGALAQLERRMRDVSLSDVESFGRQAPRALRKDVPSDVRLGRAAGAGDHGLQREGAGAPAAAVAAPAAKAAEPSARKPANTPAKVPAAPVATPKAKPGTLGPSQTPTRSKAKSIKAAPAGKRVRLITPPTKGLPKWARDAIEDMEKWADAIHKWMDSIAEKLRARPAPAQKTATPKKRVVTKVDAPPKATQAQQPKPTPAPKFEPAAKVEAAPTVRRDAAPAPATPRAAAQPQPTFDRAERQKKVDALKAPPAPAKPPVATPAPAAARRPLEEDDPRERRKHDPREIHEERERESAEKRIRKALATGTGKTSALISAAKYGDTASIEELVKAGADPTAHGNKALNEAGKRGEASLKAMVQGMVHAGTVGDHANLSSLAAGCDAETASKLREWAAQAKSMGSLSGAGFKEPTSPTSGPKSPGMSSGPSMGGGPSGGGRR